MTSRDLTTNWWETLQEEGGVFIQEGGVFIQEGGVFIQEEGVFIQEGVYIQVGSCSNIEIRSKRGSSIQEWGIHWGNRYTFGERLGQGQFNAEAFSVTVFVKSLILIIEPYLVW